MPLSDAAHLHAPAAHRAGATWEELSVVVNLAFLSYPWRKEASDQVMLDSVASNGAARGNLELAVDRGQVPVDGARTDDELFGYLCVG